MVLCNHSSLTTDPKESVKKPQQIKDQSTFGTESVTLNVEEKKKKTHRLSRADVTMKMCGLKKN